MIVVYCDECGGTGVVPSRGTIEKSLSQAGYEILVLLRAGRRSVKRRYCPDCARACRDLIEIWASGRTDERS